MRRARRLVRVALLTTGIISAGIMSALAGISISEAAALHSPSSDPVSTTLVLRGSTDFPKEDAAISDEGAPSVLRGSRPLLGPPRAAPGACPSNLDFDPNYGCVWPSFAYAPDYGYWPYGYWPDYGYWPFGFGTFDGGWRRGLRHRFAHANRREQAFRLGRLTLGGFGHGIVHAGGLAHR